MDVLTRKMNLYYDIMLLNIYNIVELSDTEEMGLNWGLDGRKRDTDIQIYAIIVVAVSRQTSEELFTCHFMSSGNIKCKP